MFSFVLPVTTEACHTYNVYTGRRQISPCKKDFLVRYCVFLKRLPLFIPRGRGCCRLTGCNHKIMPRPNYPLERAATHTHKRMKILPSPPPPLIAVAERTKRMTAAIHMRQLTCTIERIIQVTFSIFSPSTAGWLGLARLAAFPVVREHLPYTVCVSIHGEGLYILWLDFLPGQQQQRQRQQLRQQQHQVNNLFRLFFRGAENCVGFYGKRLVVHAFS